MAVDYFNTNCQQTTTEARFGLYDAEDKTPAVIKFDNEDCWNATVLNDAGKEILFTAIDNCIEILKDNGDLESRCDCMLTFDSTLLLIELKNKRGAYQAEGLAQIEATIKRLQTEEAEYYNSFNKRKAIVANTRSKFPGFQEAHIEQREYFIKKYKMRIQFEAEIRIGGV